MLIKIAVLLSVLCGAALTAGGQASLIASVLLFLGGTMGTFVLIGAVCFLLVWIPSLFADPDRECQKDSRFFRTIVRLYAPAVFTLLRTKIRITGKEKVPARGRFMLVCNHIDNLDSGVMLAAFPDSQLAFLAKKETRDFFLIGPLMGRIGCQFVDRENDRAALKAILNAIRLIKEDKVSMVAFPEGGIIEDGRKLHHFRSGVFKVAMKPQIPVVVCTIRGSTQILSNIRRFKPTQVDLRVLDVITPEQYAAMKTPELAERVYRVMRDDLGPEADAEE